MIEVVNINKSFGKNQVLFDLSAKFETGKVNMIIGQSGQGKSVLAKCIVGLHEVDQGSVLYDSRNFSELCAITVPVFGDFAIGKQTEHWCELVLGSRN